MARNVTLVNLLVYLRDRSDCQDPPFTDALMTAYLNAALAYLWDIVTEENAMWNLTSEDLTMIAGTSEYALAADYYKTHQMLAQMASGRFVPLKTIHPQQVHADYYSAGISRGLTRYFLRADTVVFVPDPAAAWTVKHRYIAGAPILGDGTGGTVTAFNSRNDWSEFVINYAWRLAWTQEESSVADLDKILMLSERRIRRAAKIINLGEPPRIRDIDAEDQERNLYE